jgi:hypothetical protein
MSTPAISPLGRGTARATVNHGAARLGATRRSDTTRSSGSLGEAQIHQVGRVGRNDGAVGRREYQRCQRRVRRAVERQIRLHHGPIVQVETPAQGEGLGEQLVIDVADERVDRGRNGGRQLATRAKLLGAPCRHALVDGVREEQDERQHRDGEPDEELPPQ